MTPTKKAEKDGDDGDKAVSSLDAFGSLVACEQDVGSVTVSPGKSAAVEAAADTSAQDDTPSKRRVAGKAKAKVKVAAGQGKAQPKQKRPSR